MKGFLKVNSIIEELREQGHDVSWYDNAAPKHELPQEQPKQCSILTRYLLEKDTAYTVNHDGSKYLDYKKLSKPVNRVTYYCSACRVKFDSFDKLNTHVGNNGWQV